MEYRLLGATGMRVSVLCLGTMNFDGTATPDGEAAATIHAALDAGINYPSICTVAASRVAAR